MKKKTNIIEQIENPMNDANTIMKDANTQTEDKEEGAKTRTVITSYTQPSFDESDAVENTVPVHIQMKRGSEVENTVSVHVGTTEEEKEESDSILNASNSSLDASNTSLDASNTSLDASNLEKSWDKIDIPADSFINLGKTM
jgi:hypothetical protein